MEPPGPAEVVTMAKMPPARVARASEAVRTGEPQIAAVRGMDAWRYLEANPGYGALHNDAMTSMSELAMEALLAAYDYSPFGTIVDVGGGHGSLLAGILGRTPAARGV